MFPTIAIMPQVNCLSFAKLLMHHKSSALIKLVQNPKPHKAFHHTETSKAQDFFLILLSPLSEDGRIQGPKADGQPNPYSIYHSASRGSCCIN